MNLIKVIVFLVVAVLIVSWTSARLENIEPDLWQPTVTINNRDFVVEVVSGADEKRQGLSGRESLVEDHGMLFIYDEKEVLDFWMKDMSFDIDLLWIDDQKVVGVERFMLAPDVDTADNELRRYNSLQAIDKVLEFPAGTIDEYSIQVGDIINFDIYDRSQVEGN